MSYQIVKPPKWPIRLEPDQKKVQWLRKLFFLINLVQVSCSFAHTHSLHLPIEFIQIYVWNKNENPGLHSLPTLKQVLSKNRSSLRCHQKFLTPKNSSDHKLQTQQRALHLPVTT